MIFIDTVTDGGLDLEPEGAVKCPTAHNKSAEHMGSIILLTQSKCCAFAFEIVKQRSQAAHWSQTVWCSGKATVERQSEFLECIVLKHVWVCRCRCLFKPYDSLHFKHQYHTYTEDHQCDNLQLAEEGFSCVAPAQQTTWSPGSNDGQAWKYMNVGNSHLTMKIFKAKTTHTNTWPTHLSSTPTRLQEWMLGHGSRGALQLDNKPRQKVWCVRHSNRLKLWLARPHIRTQAVW